MKKITWKTNSIIGLLTTISGLITYWVLIPNDIREITGYGISPRLYPQIITIIIIFLGLILATQGLVRRTSESTRSEPLDRVVIRRLLIILLVTVLYPIVLERIGFGITTFLAILGLMFLFKEKKLITSILIALIVPLIIYLLFTQLGLYLP